MIDSENRIADRKQRKIQKHYAILINGQKVKIANFRFKSYHDQYESGRLVELISKIKFPALPNDALIRIERERLY